jgi:antitoxin HicB
MRSDHLILAWPARFVPQRGGRVLVRFPDLPEAVTEGDDAADAGAQAADCLAEAIAGRINDGEPIPTPSRRAGMTTVGLEPVLAYKAALYGAMRTSNVTKSGLAKRLGIDEKDVRRLLDPRHRGSRLARLVEALAACDVRVAVALTGAGSTERVFGPFAEAGDARHDVVETVG